MEVAGGMVRVWGDRWGSDTSLDLSRRVTFVPVSFAVSMGTSE